LSYHPGGHYAPHYDYLTFKSTAQWDSWTKMLKNRFATFLLSLQRAAKGGGTVFPHLDVTVMPSPGDVVFWTNMDAHEDLVPTLLLISFSSYICRLTKTCCILLDRIYISLLSKSNHLKRTRLYMALILSYHPGGHYAPHYDYLTFKSTAQWDSWTKMLKNRFATFLLSLQRAAKGGGTVFPHLDVTVMPSPGDVIFWTNMDAHEDLANKTLHGACVVEEGVKIATTLWIRAKDQDMLLSPLHDGRFDINKLVHPNLAFFGMTPATQL
uniref:Fe2OG dioxygenase domain-containing protein n=1 Tax=Heligmosomoides polygyrus TaxID=6339 RepID=A0A183GT92_HELPZ